MPRKKSIQKRPHSLVSSAKTVVASPTPASQDGFDALFTTLSAIDLFGDAPPILPYAVPPTAAGVGGALDTGFPQLPKVFQDSYATPLKTALPHLLAGIDPNSADDLSMLETMTGAVYEHADSSIAPPLHRFLALISDLYRSFLSQKRRIAAGFPLLETLPPLAMFQHEGAGGPFTLPCDVIQREFGATAGVVSLPGVYAAHPLLWGALCHETGGHDVTHADARLLPELSQGVRTFFGNSSATLGTDAPLMGAVWSYWMDEAAADVYGLLNMGPAFGLNLIALFAALNAQGQPPAKRQPTLRTLSGFDPRDPGQLMDEHPTDILRPFLAIGVIQSLRGLNHQTKDVYAAQLTKLAQRCAGKAKTVTLAGVITDLSGARTRVTRAFPLVQMQLVARQVGAFIASAQLDALSGHSIQDLETWDDADEQTAVHISSLLQANTKVDGMGDDAQLLAGATLACFARPDLYASITNLLNGALDVSFQTDPFWSKPQPHPMFLRKVATFAQLDFLTAARICKACIRKVGNAPGDIQGQDPMSKFGIEAQPQLDDLVRDIATDATDGVPSAGFKIPNVSSLNVSKSTTLSALEVAVVNASVPAQERPL
jgi:hypothetical protein